MNALSRRCRAAAATAALVATVTLFALIGLLALPATSQAQTTLPQPEALRLRWTPDYHLNTPLLAQDLNDGPPSVFAGMPHRRSTRPFLGLRMHFNQGLTRVTLGPRGQSVRLRLSHDF